MGLRSLEKRAETRELPRPVWGSCSPSPNVRSLRGLRAPSPPAQVPPAVRDVTPQRRDAKPPRDLTPPARVVPQYMTGGFGPGVASVPWGYRPVMQRSQSVKRYVDMNR